MVGSRAVRCERKIDGLNSEFVIVIVIHAEEPDTVQVVFIIAGIVGTGQRSLEIRYQASAFC